MNCRIEHDQSHFSGSNANKSNAGNKTHNRSCNCWSPGCFVQAGEKTRVNSRIQSNLEGLKRLLGLPSQAIHFTNLTSAEIDHDRAHEALVSFITIEDDPALRSRNHTMSQLISWRTTSTSAMYAKKEQIKKEKSGSLMIIRKSKRS